MPWRPGRPVEPAGEQQQQFEMRFASEKTVGQFNGWRLEVRPVACSVNLPYVAAATIPHNADATQSIVVCRWVVGGPCWRCTQPHCHLICFSFLASAMIFTSAAGGLLGAAAQLLGLVLGANHDAALGAAARHERHGWHGARGRAAGV